MSPQSNRSKQASRLITKQLKAYKGMVEAGISIVERWARLAVEGDADQAVLECLHAFLTASYASQNKASKDKSVAAMLALKAAYLYGIYGGKHPRPYEPNNADDRSQNTQREEGL